MPRGGRLQSIPIHRSSKVSGGHFDTRRGRISSSVRWRSKTRACHGLPAKLSPKQTRLLAEVDLTAIKAQAILREALTIDAESWQGLADPEAALRSVLDILLDGDETDTLLIERLSDSPLGDLGTYPRRPRIWSRVGKPCPAQSPG